VFLSTNHPAALESAADSMSGVSIQGFFVSDMVDNEPIELFLLLLW